MPGHEFDSLSFGKHRGKPLRDVPLDYLQWCLRERAGGEHHVRMVAAFLGVTIPQREPKAGKVVASCVKYNPDFDWPEQQEYDGHTPPWEDQDTSLDAEFREMFE